MLEIEIKVRVPRETWCQVSARMKKTTPRMLEDNWLYDTPERALARQGMLLRVRKYGPRSYLTLKTPASDSAGGPYKVRREWTVRVHSARLARRILRGLGFRMWFRYQKYRTEYAYGSLNITADETPIGFFVELEGAREAIETVLREFGWTEYPRLVDNYYTLFQAARAAGRAHGRHMVFGAVSDSGGGA